MTTKSPEERIAELEKEVSDKDTLILLLRAQCRCTDKIMYNCFEILREQKVALNQLISMLTPGTQENYKYLQQRMEDLENSILKSIGKK